MTILIIVGVVVVLIPIGIAVTAPTRDRKRERRRTTRQQTRTSNDESSVADLVEGAVDAAFDARARHRSSAPTFSYPVRARGFSAHGHRSEPADRGPAVLAVPVERSDGEPVVERHDPPAELLVERHETPDSVEIEIGDGSDVAPASWDPVDGESCSFGGFDDD